MVSVKDLALIKYFNKAILSLRYGKKIEYQLIDTEELVKEHIISIHKLDDEHFIVKLIYKLSIDDVCSINKSA